MPTAISADVVDAAATATPALFTEAELDGLPTAVRRYMRTAVAPDTPLAATAQLRMWATSSSADQTGSWRQYPFGVHVTGYAARFTA